MKIYFTVFSRKGNIFMEPIKIRSSQQKVMQEQCIDLHIYHIYIHLHLMYLKRPGPDTRCIQTSTAVIHRHHVMLLCSELLCSCSIRAVSCCPGLSVSSEDRCSGSPGWSKTDGMGCGHRRSFSHFCYIVKLRQGSGKDRQGMALKAKGLKA